MQEITDDSVFEKFIQAELKTPTPRKMIGDKIIYNSRGFEPPKVLDQVLLCDFGSAVQGEETRNNNAQPTIFQSPEVMLQVNWSYSTDIWNLGVMVCGHRLEDFRLA